MHFMIFYLFFIFLIFYSNYFFLVVAFSSYLDILLIFFSNSDFDEPSYISLHLSNCSNYLFSSCILECSIFYFSSWWVSYYVFMQRILFWIFNVYMSVNTVYIYALFWDDEISSFRLFYIIFSITYSFDFFFYGFFVFCALLLCFFDYFGLELS
jgi:hypothetical protein